jgi:hypothetical protein
MMAMLARSNDGDPPMNRTTLLSLALLAGTLVLPAIASAERVPLPPDFAATRGKVPQLLVKRVRVDRPDGVTAPKATGDQVLPGTPMANPFRAYPPSCAADPLPDEFSGPVYQATVPLFARAADGSDTFTEDVEVTVWRLACSSSGSATDYNPTGAGNAITLMRIDRQAEYEGDAEIYPTFPIVEVSQDGSGLGGFESLVRVAVEPNTIISEVPFDSPIIDSTTYVLENFPYQGSGYFTFSDAFTLRIDPFSDDAPVDIAVPAYNPTQATYPAAFQAREIDGYSAAQWVNRDLNEGLLLQVTEQLQDNGTTVRQVVFDLLLEDNNGDPLWLIGNAAFTIGAKTLDIDLAYLGNGLAQIPWGTATIEVADCNHLDVTYASTPQADDSIPVFDGLTTYERLFAPNGMVCE